MSKALKRILLETPISAGWLAVILVATILSSVGLPHAIEPPAELVVYIILGSGFAGLCLYLFFVRVGAKNKTLTPNSVGLILLSAVSALLIGLGANYLA